MSRSQSNTTEVISYAHLYDQCTQNWYAVTSILEGLLKQLKVKNPLLQKVHLRLDEAGCYHNSSLVTVLRDVSRCDARVISYNTTPNWSDAQSICQTHGAHLPILHIYRIFVQLPVIKYKVKSLYTGPGGPWGRYLTPVFLA